MTSNEFTETVSAIQLYPSRAHLLTQKPVWVEFNLPDVPDIGEWYISSSSYSDRIPFRAGKVAFNDDATRMYVELSVSNISANCVPYTTSITPNTPIFLITKE